MELYHSNRNSKTASLFMKCMPRTRKGYRDEIAFCAPCKKGYTHTYTLSLPLTVLQGVNKRASIPRAKGELLYVECPVLWQDLGEVAIRSVASPQASQGLIFPDKKMRVSEVTRNEHQL